jgi:uncharacterized membrane protein
MIAGISIGQAIKAAWKGFKENLGFFLLATLLIVAVKILYYWSVGIDFEDDKERVGGFLGLILFIAETILLLFLYLGLFRVSLEVIRGNKASWRDFPSTLSDLTKFFVGSILYILIWLAGLILLVFPAFIWGTRYGLYPFMIADKQANGLDSLKMSARATYGYKWDLFALFLVLALISIGIIFTLGLGYFIFIPLWSLAMAYFYHNLTKE